MLRTRSWLRSLLDSSRERFITAVSIIQFLKNSLSAIVLGLSAVVSNGCIMQVDLRKEYPIVENISGKIVDVDEDSFDATFMQTIAGFLTLQIGTTFTVYQFPFEIVRVNIGKEVKKVLIPHASSYSVGDKFSSPCHKVDGSVSFEVLARASKSLPVAQNANVGADYLYLKDIIYSTDKK